ncbi:MAG TPA: SagB family peptide dehydrogenase, partial [Rugosimonospora sp.]|nr:SagB family peptide dehydrogenase [Rugosimonospora sp.]
PAVLRAVGLTATAATRVLAELVDAGLLVAPTESAPPRAIRLPVPDLARRAGTEPSLTDVVAARRSIREHDDAVPIDRAALGEFLYRVQRAWDVREPGGPEPEVYPLVTRCAGVDPGLYRYDSIGHELVPLAAPGPLADRLLDSARDAASMVGRPQVLLVCTARVSRRMRQDGGPALAAARRDAGVLTELMYLVATAMGLAPCAVGPADPTAFAELSGTDPLPEPGTARFLLGSRRPPA